MTSEWSRCMPYIQTALDHAGNLFTVNDVFDLVTEGKAHFWPGKNCAIITEVRQFPQKRLCNVWLGGGDLEELKVMAEYVRLYAKQMNCDAITIQGRPGWQKVFGLKVKSVTLIEEVSK